MTTERNALKVTFPSDREVQMTRVFNAPRELVFQAHVDPEVIPQWWGMRSSVTTVDKMDPRPGGEWRFVQREPNGTEYGFHGEFREVVPPERIVWTFEYEGMPGHVAIDTVTFEERDGKTTLTTRSVFSSAEDLKGMVESGMEAGAAETYDRLEEYLAKAPA